MHVTDWIPTLLEAVRPSLNDSSQASISGMGLDTLDGVNQWPGLTDPNSNQTLRSEVLVNIDPEKTSDLNGLGQAGLIQGDMKLLLGHPGIKCVLAVQNYGSKSAFQ